MRAFVFTDRALERHAGRFVWLSINADQERNAGFLEKFPIGAFPTFLVIDPRGEEPVLRWMGGATVRRLERLLDDARRSLRGKAKGADALLAAADRLLGAGDSEIAAVRYDEALAKAPTGWPHRERAVESLLTVLGTIGEDARCVEVARARMPADRSAHLLNVVAAGLGCALALEPKASAGAVEFFEAAARAALAEPRIAVPVDDRSSLYALVVDARTAAGDESGARETAREWLSYLEHEAEIASSPAARAVFDPHRLSASIAAREPERAIAALRRSEADFPSDYNPAARLAVAYRELGRYDESLASADRALSLAYGPRKIRIYTTKSDTLEKKGDTETAKAVLKEAVRYAEGLPKSQVPPRSLDALRKKLAAMPPLP